MPTLKSILLLCLSLCIGFSHSQQTLQTGKTIEAIQKDGYFDLPLTYNRTTHLWMIPVYLGFHIEDYGEPFWCALDFTIPSVIVPNTQCSNCVGKKYSDGHTNHAPSEQFNYPHKMMYRKFTDGSFEVQEEEQMMVLGYNPAHHLKDQIQFRTFEFYSILSDKDQQSVDSLFGLGIQPPGHSTAEGYMNIVEWLHSHKYITDKKVSIYISNYDGTESEEIKEDQKDLELPPSHVKFGEYNTTGLAKDSEIYFWTTTSQYNWTLDLFEIQYGSSIYDIDASEEDTNGAQDKAGVNSKPAPKWQKGSYNDDKKPTQDTVIKALINPSSPFIALPQDLFKKIAEDWMDSFRVDQQPACSDEACVVMSKCSEISVLQDFGLRLGSLNDTDSGSVSQAGDAEADTDERYNMLHRGPDEIEYHKQKAQFFKIPFESYLIPGEQLDRDENVCFLGVTGFIPDGERLAVLGQPFLQNYYTVLDMDSMEIGLAAHIGTEAEISATIFTKTMFYVKVFLATFMCVMFLVIGLYYCKYKRDRKNSIKLATKEELTEAQNVAEQSEKPMNEQPVRKELPARRNSKMKYLPLSADNDVDEENQLLKSPQSAKSPTK